MMNLIDQGTFNAAGLDAFVDVATLSPPETAGQSYAYLLVARFSALDVDHELQVRSRQGAVVQRDVFTTQPGNGQVNDEIEWEEFVAAGEEPITIAVTDTGAGSVGVGGFWYLYRDAQTVSGTGEELPPGPADNFYVRRVDLLLAMGQEPFDAEIRLDPSATVADETIVAELLRDTGDQIDLIAMDIGLTMYEAGPAAGHYVDPNSADLRERIVFTAVRKAGALYARALARAIRPDRDDEPRPGIQPLGTPPPAQSAGQNAGGMTKLKNNALERIRAALAALMYQRDLVTARPDSSIVAVGWSANTRCRPATSLNLPPGVDPGIIF